MGFFAKMSIKSRFLKNRGSLNRGLILRLEVTESRPPGRVDEMVNNHPLAVWRLFPRPFAYVDEDK